MPQIAQQDYKVIAPKEGRGLLNDAAATGELKKALLNGIAFDCLLKDPSLSVRSLTRVVYVVEDVEDEVAFIDPEDNSVNGVLLSYTVTQYQGLAAVQNAIDDKYGVMDDFPTLVSEDSRLTEGANSVSICVDSKYLTPTASGGKLTALAIAETGPSEGDDYINITWEDAQKLIGLPLV